MQLRDLEKQARKRLTRVGDHESYTAAIIQIASSLVPKDVSSLMELANENLEFVLEPPVMNLGGSDRALDLIAWKVFEAIEDHLWSRLHYKILD